MLAQNSDSAVRLLRYHGLRCDGNNAENLSLDLLCLGQEQLMSLWLVELNMYLRPCVKKALCLIRVRLPLQHQGRQRWQG